MTLRTLFAAALFCSVASATTYCVRADGTAPNLAASTSCTSAATSMSETAARTAAFVAGDIVQFSSRGGTFGSSVNPQVAASGSSGNPIIYKGEPGFLPVWELGFARAGWVISSKDYVEVNDMTMHDCATSCFQTQGTSTGVVIRNPIGIGSDNQVFQHLNTASVTYYNAYGSLASDEVFSMHDTSTAVVNEGIFETSRATGSGDKVAVNWVGTPSFTGYDITIQGFTGPALAIGGSGALFQCERCLIIEAPSLAVEGMNLGSSGGTGTYTFKNTIFQNLTSASYYINAGATPTGINFINCTFQGDGSTPSIAMIDASSSAAVYKNNIFSSVGTQAFSGATGTISYNLFYNSGTARGTNTVTSGDPGLDAAGHIGSGSNARGAGIGPSSDAAVPTVDIDGDARSGTTTDLGADQFVVTSTAYTTVRSGNVNDTSHTTGPWCSTSTPCTLPTSGDTVTIANGHTLNIPASVSWTIGNSADLATYALRTAGTGGTGILTMQPGSTLTLKGHVLQGNATWQVGTTAGGADVIFDHSSTNLTWIISDASSQANAKLQIRGIAGDRSTFTKSGGGVPYSFKPSTTSINDGGRIDAQYADFTSCGSTSISCMAFRGTSSAFTLSLVRVKLTSSGQLTQVGIQMHGAANVILDYVSIVTPTVASDTWANFAPDNITTGTRTISNSVFRDSLFNCNPALTGNLGWTFSNVFIRNTNQPGTIQCTGSTSMGTITNLLQFVENDNIGGATIHGADITGLYILNGATATNSHPFRGPAYNSTIQKVVLESMVGQTEGDMFLTLASGTVAVQTITIKDLLVIQPAGTYYGVLVNHTAASAHSAGVNNYPNFTVRNFTWRGGGSAGGSIQHGAAGGGEHVANVGKLGLYADVSHHLVWSETASTPAFVTDYISGAGTPPVAGTFTAPDHNWFWNTVGGSGATHTSHYKYSTTDPTVYGTTPGANDTTGINPRFPDTTYGILAFGQAINPSLTTGYQVMDEFAKVADDSGYDPRFNIADLIANVRWRHVPQEPRVWVGCNGTYCGGVDPTPLKISSAASIF